MTSPSPAHAETSSGHEEAQALRHKAEAEAEEARDHQALRVDTQDAKSSDDGEDRERAAKLGRELFVFTNAKAGMQSVDAARVQQVVYDMSKDSAFFQNSLRQNDRVEARIRGMHAHLAQLSRARREQLSKDIDRRVAQLESARSLARTIVVVDMDMFYAAVEMRDNPALRDVPLAVGGLSMISTTNYAARKFGVRAAMPGFIGKELCPALVFVPPNFGKYTQVAQQIRAVFAKYDPDFSAFSLDEACLDISDYMAANWQRYVGDGNGDVVDEEEDEGKEEGDSEDSDEMVTGEWGEDDEEDGHRGLEDIIGASSASDDDCGQCLPGSNAAPDTGRMDKRNTDAEDVHGDAFAAMHAANKSRKRRRASLNRPGVPSSVRLEVASAIVKEMRRKILEETQLTASAGIACNTMLAKVLVLSGVYS
jgi:nucleotidyltransferase/DNA polymerase involved in DNA repair